MDDILSQQLAAARDCLNRNELEGAQFILDELLRIYPESGQIWCMQGDVCMRKEDVQRAKDCFAKALELGSDVAWARTGLGDACKRLGDLQDAVVHYQAALAAKEDLPWVRIALGDVWGRLNEWRLAYENYQLASQIDDRLPQAKLGLGNAALQLQDLTAARDFFQQTIILDPDAVWAHVGLGRCLMQEGNWSEALASLQKARGLEPGNNYIDGLFEEARGQLPPADPNADLVREADLAYGENLLDRARSLYEQLRVAMPNNPHPLCRLGEIALRRGDVDVACSFYQAAAEVDADYLWPQVGLGNCHANRKDWGKAAQCYREALHIDPTVDYVRQLACDAEASLAMQEQQISRLLPHADKAYANGDMNLAESAYLELRAIAPLLVHPLCRLGEIAMKRGDAETAESFYKEAVAVDGAYVWAQHGLGNALMAKGEFGAARVAFSKAKQLRPDLDEMAIRFGQSVAQDLLAQAKDFEAGGRLDEARRLLAQAMLYDPAGSDVIGFALTMLEMARDGEMEPLDAHSFEVELHEIYLEGLEDFVSAQRGVAGTGLNQ